MRVRHHSITCVQGADPSQTNMEADMAPLWGDSRLCRGSPVHVGRLQRRAPEAPFGTATQPLSLIIVIQEPRQFTKDSKRPVLA